MTLASDVFYLEGWILELHNILHLSSKESHLDKWQFSVIYPWFCGVLQKQPHVEKFATGIYFSTS